LIEKPQKEAAYARFGLQRHRGKTYIHTDIPTGRRNVKSTKKDMERQRQSWNDLNLAAVDDNA
jgi:hypothetical protein